MNIIENFRIRYTIYGLCLLCYLGLTFLTGDTADQFRQEYYLCLIPESVSPEQAVADLRSQLSPRGIVSGETAMVTFTRFDRLEQVKLKDLAGRLDPRDPRLDSYLQSLEGFFHSVPGWHVMFVSTDAHPLLFFMRSRQMAEKVKYPVLVPEIDPVRELAPGIVFCFFFILFLIVRRKHPLKLLICLSLIPWGLYILAGGMKAVILLMIILPFQFLLLEAALLCLEEWHLRRWHSFSGLVLRGINYLLAIAVAALFCSRLGGPGFPLWPVLANWALGGGYLVFYLRVQIKRKHPLFRMVPFDTSRKLQYIKIKMRNIAFIFPIALVITFIPIYYFTKSSTNDIETPVLVAKYDRKQHAIKNLEEMQLMENDENFPSFTDYLNHLSFQENLKWGQSYNGEPVTVLESYTEGPAGTISSSLKALEPEFASVKKIIDNLGPDSLEKMLYNEGRILQFSRNTGKRSVEREYRSWRGTVWYYLVLLPLFFLYFYLTPAVLSGIKNLILRRKQNTS